MTHHFKRERVAVDAIVFDAGTQIRAAINEQIVADYAEQMTDGVKFPPIVLFHDGVRYYLADGFHRTLAAKRNQFRDIEADVETGTRADALWYALGANKANGQRLTAADKKQAIKMALEAFPDRSGNQIAEQIGVNQRYVGEVRAQVSATTNLPARVTGKDGKSYPATRGTENPKLATVKDLLQAGATTDAIRKAVGGASNTLITQARRALGIGDPIDKSRAAVQARRDRMRIMAAEGYTSRQIAAELNLAETGCRLILRTEGIDVPADRAVGRARRHDANRIVDQMVADAENLCADVNLINFAELDREQIGPWIESLGQSRRALNAFIRRLEEEKKKHGEAA